MAKQGESINRIQERSGKTFEWYDEPPPRPDPAVEQLFLEAFSDLSRERDVGMGIGPIPFQRMSWYAREHRGMDDEDTRFFCDVLMEMDDRYLKDLADEKAKSDPPTSGSRLKQRRSLK